MFYPFPVYKWELEVFFKTYALSTRPQMSMYFMDDSKLISLVCIPIISQNAMQ